jgi:hypothetical protein
MPKITAQRPLLNKSSSSSGSDGELPKNVKLPATQQKTARGSFLPDDLTTRLNQLSPRVTNQDVYSGAPESDSRPTAKLRHAPGQFTGPTAQVPVVAAGHSQAAAIGATVPFETMAEAAERGCLRYGQKVEEMAKAAEDAKNRAQASRTSAEALGHVQEAHTAAKRTVKAAEKLRDHAAKAGTDTARTAVEKADRHSVAVGNTVETAIAAVAALQRMEEAAAVPPTRDGHASLARR